jgi:asparagine synthase (glutamine-hydrolysing)
MSAILGVFGDAPTGEDAVRSMLGRMAARGADEIGVWHGREAVLGVCRHAFELGQSCSGPVTVVEDGNLVIAADASLYYRHDLRRLLGAERATVPDTPSHLLLAAYRRWGPGCVLRLEGDFAFVLYDRAAGLVLCGRDPAGRRPLHYAEAGGTLIIASTIGGVLGHPSVSGELNVAALAETAGALFAASHETVFRSVHALRAGWLLTRRGGAVATQRFWRPPPVSAPAATSLEEGAAELRELLVAAVAERLDAAAPTSVWLSGGWDSPAVFAAGEEHYRRRGAGESLRPVSISYPPGDPGREDDLIASALEHWGRRTHWIDVDSIPFLDRPGDAAAVRDEPFVHAFEHWLRALARGSRAVGTRIALDGTGSDQIFSSSLLYLADLLRSGRWRELRREWDAKGLRGTGARQAFDLLLQPLLPGWLREVGRAVRPGRSWAGAFEAHVPDWIDPDFARRHGLWDRARRSAPPPAGTTLADAELEYYLTHPTGPRLVSAYAGLALEEGVEVRSPFYDGRVIEFAIRRPLAERTSGNQTKRLLRRACAGWLPEPFLAPRRHRTGGTGAYAHRSLRRTHAGLVSGVLNGPLLLAELGIVRPGVLAARWSEFLNGVSRYELPLYLTFQTELWLRARSEAPLVDATSPALPVEALA